MIISNRVFQAFSVALLLLGTACVTGDNNSQSTDVNDSEENNDIDNNSAANNGGPVEIQLVTIAENDAGWWVINGESAWVSAACRQSIESRGGTFSVVPWADIEATADATVERNCDEISGLYFPDDTTANNENNAAVSNPFALLRGMNLAGDFEVEPRGSWGSPIDEGAFARIATAGFDHVRLPIRWSSYTGVAPNYTIDETFFSEVDRMVELAIESNLGIVVNVHFFEELEIDPVAERDRFFAIWDQIARRYQGEPSSVVFELMNEPIGVFLESPELWNELAAGALAVVRETNPTRSVMIGPVEYNHPSRLSDLELPVDNNLIATIHSYDPFEFTHQGAEFVDPVPATGVLWSADAAMIDFDWEDRSWQTTISSSSTGITAEYQNQYAGFAILTSEPSTFQELQIETDKAFEAIALCNYGTEPVVNVAINFNGTTGTADVSACGDITTLAIQLDSADPIAVNFSRIALCNEGCLEVIVTQYDALNRQISEAATWAANRGVPLYLGEFGTIDPPGTPTDPQSRTDWTRSMRTIAESYGVGWAYFAHDDAFGAWDRTTQQWVPAVLDALID